MNTKFSCIPRQVKVTAKPKGKLTIAWDELWSFVSSKQNPLYIWLAIDRETKEIVGCYVGDRSRQLYDREDIIRLQQIVSLRQLASPSKKSVSAWNNATFPSIA